MNPNVSFPATVQSWYRGDSVGGPRVIRALGSRDTRGNPTVKATVNITIKLDNSTLGFSSLNRTWSKNLSQSATTVFSGKVNYQAGSGNDPNKAIAWAPTSQPYVFRGPNLLVQATAKSTTTANSKPFGYDALNQGSSSTVHSTFGRSCGGQLAASYASGRFALTAKSRVQDPPVRGSSWMPMAINDPHSPMRLTAASETVMLRELAPVERA